MLILDDDPAHITFVDQLSNLIPEIFPGDFEFLEDLLELAHY